MGDSSVAGSARWGFIGSGKMASALIRGMIARGVAADRISASDASGEARDRLVAEAKIVGRPDNAALVDGADVVVLAVKPQAIAPVLAEIAPKVEGRHLVVSIAAGVTLATLHDGLGLDRRIVRVMPNTPALVGEGASAYALGPKATEQDEATVKAALESVGRAFRVSESMLDAVTGLSGSGPAFACLMIEALSDGGVRVGLPRDLATTLAAQTLLGTAKLVLETGEHPGAIKDQVTSPAGTTIAGLHAMERAGVRGGLIDAVEAAFRRSVELAEASAKVKTGKSG